MLASVWACAFVPDAAQAESVPPTATTRIIGGQASNVSEFPWTAALIRKGAPGLPDTAICGATVIAPSWVVTAAHCVVDYLDAYPDTYPGPAGEDYVGPEALDVLTGVTQLSRADSGQRLAVAAVYPHASYTGPYNDYDFALLRLAKPTRATPIAIVGTSTADKSMEAAGRSATAVGWGYDGDSYPDSLRSVELSVLRDATCEALYPAGRVVDGEPTEYRSQSMLCAGDLAGGHDACQGDSGGPLAGRSSDGKWKLLGVISWGDGCAQANRPGVYSRVSAASGWIERTRRFGPFDTDATSFIVRQFVDFNNRWPTPSELSSWQSRLTGSTPASSLTAQLAASTTWQDNAGSVTRLYRAAFLRAPETGGLGYWVGVRWGGRTLPAIAETFASSPEFINRYGDLDDAGFVDRIYQNVLGRPPDDAGARYWQARLAGSADRGDVLSLFADSSEYRRTTATEVRETTIWFGMLRQAPTAGELTANSNTAATDLIDSLRLSYRYSARFER